MNITATARKAANGTITISLTTPEDDYTLTYMGNDTISAMATAAATNAGILNPMTARLSHNLEGAITQLRGPHAATVTLEAR